MLEGRQTSLLASLVPVIEGTDKARCLAIASFTIVYYEHFLTLDQEVSIGLCTILLYVNLWVCRLSTSGEENGPLRVYYTSL